METKNELFSWAETEFKNQLGLDLNEILSIKDGKFSITRDNKMGLSMASLRLDLDRDGHGKMANILTLIDNDKSY